MLVLDIVIPVGKYAPESGVKYLRVGAVFRVSPVKLDPVCGGAIPNNLYCAIITL
jgi:hypothetical protein